MTRYVYSTYGNEIAVGVYGDTTEEVTHTLDHLYNFNATNSDIHWLSDKFGYVLSSWDKLEKGFADMEIAKILKKHVDAPLRVKRGLRDIARQSAKSFVSEIPFDNFVNQHSPPAYVYSYAADGGAIKKTK